ncbi:hypothetical protein PR048_006163 [Dryococelus australis]|uniref:Uncharacterized protein n=1 Tax=Dryococelus australis TaxID=614101 RepID=A0ABQ9IA82_9NEOP|nr:hypothetical protein PR048_006163 [Dryococelus australis]
MLVAGVRPLSAAVQPSALWPLARLCHRFRQRFTRAHSREMRLRIYRRSFFFLSTSCLMSTWLNVLLPYITVNGLLVVLRPKYLTPNLRASSSATVTRVYCNPKALEYSKEHLKTHRNHISWLYANTVHLYRLFTYLHYQRRKSGVAVSGQSGRWFNVKFLRQRLTLCPTTAKPKIKGYESHSPCVYTQCVLGYMTSAAIRQWSCTASIRLMLISVHSETSSADVSASSSLAMSIRVEVLVTITERVASTLRRSRNRLARSAPDIGVPTDLLTNSQCDNRTEHPPRRRHRGANPRPSDYRSATLPLSYEGRAICRLCVTAYRLARSPPTKANRVQFPAGSPDFRTLETCRTMPLAGGFSRGSPVSPAPSFRQKNLSRRSKQSPSPEDWKLLSASAEMLAESLLASYPGEPGSIPGSVSLKFLHVRIVPNDAAGRWVSSGIFHFPHCCISPFRPHQLSRPGVKSCSNLAKRSTPTQLQGPLKRHLDPSVYLTRQSNVTSDWAQWPPRGKTALQASHSARRQAPRVGLSLGQLALNGSVMKGENLFSLLMWESCPCGNIVRRSAVRSIISFRRCSIPTSTLVGYEDLAVKSHTNFITHSLVLRAAKNPLSEVSRPPSDYNPFTVTSNFYEALPKLYFQDISLPHKPQIDYNLPGTDCRLENDVATCCSPERPFCCRVRMALAIDEDLNESSLETPPKNDAGLSTVISRVSGSLLKMLNSLLFKLPSKNPKAVGQDIGLLVLIIRLAPNDRALQDGHCDITPIMQPKMVDESESGTRCLCSSIGRTIVVQFDRYGDNSTMLRWSRHVAETGVLFWPRGEHEAASGKTHNVLGVANACRGAPYLASRLVRSEGVASNESRQIYPSPAREEHTVRW